MAVRLFNTNPVQADTVEIGLAWAGKSGMAKRVVKGFEEGIQYRDQLCATKEELA